MDQSFSEKNLWRLLQKGDGQRYSLGNTRKDIRRSLHTIAERANSDEFRFSPLLAQMRNHKPVLSVGPACDEFILRKLADNLRRALMIKAADRNTTVKQVITLAREARAAKIIKLDIARFFESIDKIKLLKDLQSEHSISPRTYHLLRELFSSAQIRDASGLPRGLSVSSVLAEYYLRQFEHACHRLPYCYHFARYVDDMVFFCHGDASNIESSIKDILPNGLELNHNKTTKITITKLGKLEDRLGAEDRLSYLGYELIFSSVKDLQISIPPKKISKIKTRIIYSLLEYCRNTSYPLLEARINFLTSNFRISDTAENGTLFSGIYYNHQHTDEASCITIFQDIDRFLRSAIYSKQGSLGRRLYPLLTNIQRKKLASCSFLRGYQEPVYRDFKPTMLAAIKEVWSHA